MENKYKVSYNIEDLLKNVTVLDNTRSKCLSKLSSYLIQRNCEQAINIAIELNFSGYTDVVLTKITDFYIKNINLAQPRGILYISDFYNYYDKKYDKKEKKNNKILIINDQIVRNFISCMISLICVSNQRKILTLPKITNDDFNFKNRKKVLTSKNLNLVSKYIHKNDNKHLIIPLSEIINLLTIHYLDSREQNIIYWISWLMVYEKTFHKGKLGIHPREVDGVESKYTKDFLWIIWEMLIDCIQNEDVLRYINALEKIFKQNFTNSNRKKKINLLIIAILIYINPMPQLKSPIPSIDNSLFKKIQYETLVTNIKYFAIKRHLVIENL